MKDTLVVTEDEIEELTRGAPLELAGVEALMRDEGTQLSYVVPVE